MLRFAVYLILLAVAAFVMGGTAMTFLMPPAHGATCLHRPGVSHGSVWWRWRYANGARCWYPGSRYASRRHSRPVALRVAENRKESREPEAPPAGVSAPATRQVRVIPITKAGITVNQRVERAFDRLMIFPVIDEE